MRGWAANEGGKQVKDFQVDFHPQEKQPLHPSSPLQEESQEDFGPSRDAKRQQQHSLLDDQIQ